MPDEPQQRFPDDVDPEAANDVDYSVHAKHYQDRAEERYANNDLWLLPILGKIGTSPGARALDVGCAVGTNARYLAKHGYDVTGIDSSPEMVQRAWSEGQRSGLDNPPRILHRDFRRWTATGGMFNLVLATSFVHLFPEPQDERITETILSHVAPGGTAIVSTTVEVAHSQGMRPKHDDYPDTSPPPGFQRWRINYTEESFWNLILRVAARMFGGACVLTKQVMEDPGRPNKFWCDIVVTRTDSE